MTQIKIEVPSNDPIALSALGEALQRIAAERTNGSGEVDKSQLTGQPSERDIDACLEPINLKPTRIVKPDTTIDVELKDDVTKREGDLVTSNDVKGYETVDSNPAYEGIVPSNIMEEHVDDTTEQYEAGGGVEDDTLDADGLPWDKRIHSRGKTRLADDTWRLARKPNDKTQEEWDEYVASVKAELKAVQDIPVPNDTVTIATDVNNVEYQQTQGVISPDCKVEVTLDEQATVETLTPPVVETVTPPTLDNIQLEGVTPNGDVAIDSGSQAMGEPIAAVEPPTSVTAPVVESNEQLVNGKPYSEVIKAGSEFQSLMMYITQSKQRGLTVDMVNEALLEVSPNLNKLPLIATNLKLIPSFVAKLEAKLS